MTTSQACKLLECTPRHLYDLRNRRFPIGHPDAGKPLLGPSWQIGHKWRYSDEGVYAYREWLILGKPLTAPKKKMTLPVADVEARLQRVMQRSAAR